MEYKIYQIKHEHLIAFGFLGLNRNPETTMEHYGEVYSGEVSGLNDFEELERLFQLFNVEHPPDYRGRSMSVGDIVILSDQTGDRYYYCDILGFKQTKT